VNNSLRPTPIPQIRLINQKGMVRYNEILMLLSALVFSFVFAIFSITTIARVIADNVICTDFSLCITTNSSNVSIFENNITNNTKSEYTGTAVMVGSGENNSFTRWKPSR
jgi:hypothetical protein